MRDAVPFGLQRKFNDGIGRARESAALRGAPAPDLSNLGTLMTLLRGMYAHDKAVADRDATRPTFAPYAPRIRVG